MNKTFSVIASLALVMLLTNCAKNISSNEYSEAEVGAIKQTYRGVVLNARNVKVQGADRLQDNGMGVVGGGVAGGVLGSMVGKGRGSTLGMLAGAAAGALGGAMAEKKLKEQDGVEYTVELKSGRVMTIVQGPEPRLHPGQHVLVMVGSRGRSRVVLDQTGGASYSRGAAPAAAQPAHAHPTAPVAPAPAYTQPTYAHPQPQQPSVHAVDHNHRDAYARDVVERSNGPRVIVQ